MLNASGLGLMVEFKETFPVARNCEEGLEGGGMLWPTVGLTEIRPLDLLDKASPELSL